MLHSFRKRPAPEHLKRNSFSFSVGEVSKVCFNDDIEIIVFNEDNVEITRHQLSGFVFINSIIKRKTNSNQVFYTIKL